MNAAEIIAVANLAAAAAWRMAINMGWTENTTLVRMYSTPAELTADAHDPDSLHELGLELDYAGPLGELNHMEKMALQSGMFPRRDGDNLLHVQVVPRTMVEALGFDFTVLSAVSPP